jgi:hypothetical protein
LSNVKTPLFVVYIDTGRPVPYIPSNSRGLADENKKIFVVTLIALTPEVVCLTFQTSRHEKYGT